MIVKNSFGCSAVFSSRPFKKRTAPRFGGSSQQRAKKPIYPKVRNVEPDKEKAEKKEPKPRQMSGRTKTKIRNKLFAFSQLNKDLTFVTLTFVNEVSDQVAVKLLKKFIDNYKKRDKNLEYLWVAERQTSNKTFKDNIHFHLITNQYWKIEQAKNYWIRLQKKAGIVPRDLSFSPSSAFDVKKIKSNEHKHLGIYMTKYVTKNKAEFNCQVWNCSKSFSALYTCMYSGFEFVEKIRALKGDQVKEVPLEYCTLYQFNIDKDTMPLYDPLKIKNRYTTKELRK